MQTKIPMVSRRSCSAPLALAAALLLATLPAPFAVAGSEASPGAPPSSKAEKASPASQFGEFTIQQAASWVTTFSTGSITADLTGEPIIMTSPQYQLSAKIVHIVVKKGTKVGSTYKATGVTATGSVKIEVHDPDPSRSTVLTCDKVVYTATIDPNDRGKMVLTGHVHVVTKDAALAQPAVLDSDSAIVTFPDADSYRVELGHTNVKATLIEQAPTTPQKKKP